jgi:hypothetical protein
MPKQAVSINPAGRVIAEDRVARVRKQQNENVMWVALGNGGPWLVTFDKEGHQPAGSPFNQAEYFVPRGEFVQTAGGPTAGVVGGKYKYNVREARSGIITDDPDIDVDP